MSPIDPYNVDPLEKSLNELAVRVSTIWVSYLLFGFYLLVGVGTVTHRQLLLDQALKLPVLNIDLPLVGFFFLAPLLFVLFHGYVLLQLVLLARTAAEYNSALEYIVKLVKDRTRIRQRLTNTLFAQILAGSHREREGLLGWLLRLIALLTVIILPISVLLFTQLKFLPYHSHPITWAHRMLIFLDLFLLLLLWPAILDGNRDVRWSGILRGRVLLGSCAVVAIVSVLVVTFPTERHATLSRSGMFGYAIGGLRDANQLAKESTICDRRSLLHYFSTNFDRLSLTFEAFVDDAKVAKGEAKQGSSFQNERSNIFDNRDLACADLRFTDLRLTDFDRAIMMGAQFDSAELTGASMQSANLTGASFRSARLDGTSFSHAYLAGANFGDAHIQKGDFRGSRLSSANFASASLQNANFDGSQVLGTNFRLARLQNASFIRTTLYGADFSLASLQGAMFKEGDIVATIFEKAGLQGAIFQSARLGGVSFVDARLQGVNFTFGTKLVAADFSRAYLWRTGHVETEGGGDAGSQNRATASACASLLLEDAHFEPIIGFLGSPFNLAQPEDFDEWEKMTFKDVELSARDRLRLYLQNSFVSDSNIDVDAYWKLCKEMGLTKESFDSKLAAYLVEKTCLAGNNARYIALGFLRFNDSPVLQYKVAIQQFARTMLEANEGTCSSVKVVGDATKAELRKIVSSEPHS